MNAYEVSRKYHAQTVGMTVDQAGALANYLTTLDTNEDTVREAARRITHLMEREVATIDAGQHGSGNHDQLFGDFARAQAVRTVMIEAIKVFCFAVGVDAKAMFADFHGAVAS
jgi:hypothetical protein